MVGSSISEQRRWEPVRCALDAWAERIPSLSLAVYVDGRERFAATVGKARLEPPRAAVDDQIYDLASVTKALVGSTVAAALVQEGRLDLDAGLVSGPPGATALHLLQHASGWPAWTPLARDLSGPPDAATRRTVIDRAWAVPIVAGPGAAHAYSDIGFIALTDVLERAGGDRLDALFGRLVAAPLASRLCFDGVGAAATEDCTLRGRVIEGEVHDPHAWWMQGVSAHAGLFGSARAVASIAEGLRQAVADPSRWPPGAVLGRLWKARGPGSHVGGWDTPTRGGYTSTGGRFPDDAVGHLGYTGTSLWVVPSWRASVALLTNRIHPRDDKAAIRDARPEIHDAVASALEV